MIQIISILLEQQPMRIGPMEKECVDKSLRIALQVVKDDLDYMNSLDRVISTSANASEENNQERQQLDDGGGDVDGGDYLGGSDQHMTAIACNDLPSSTSIRLRPRPCPTLFALSHIFNKKKVYYKAQSRQWHNGPSMGGLPELRNQMISVFRRINGLAALRTYMEIRVGNVDSFPDMEFCKDILGAVIDGLPTGFNYGMVSSSGGGGSSSSSANEDMRGQAENSAELQLSKRRYILLESKAIASAIMKHTLLLDEITLKKMDTHTVQGIRRQLHFLHSRICDADGTSPPVSRSREDDTTPPPTQSDEGVVGGPKSLYEFFTFWRALALKLITSQSLPLKLFGWDEISHLISESEMMAPPPRAYRVTGAGTTFINGLYEFDAKRVGRNGYVKSGVELQYHRKIPLVGDGEDGNGSVGAEPIPATPIEMDGAGKTLTLFRCTMRSSHKWWFLSEADEDQPGTDKDIDYYQHKSKKDEESLPSHSGWLTCRAGTDPPPTLEPVGKLVPKGEEFNTLDHLLARWAIDNGVIELVLGDGIHREVVSRSAGLIKFLAGMCSEDIEQDVDNSVTMSADRQGISKYCLKASHLLLAWKTCTNKADAAVSAQIYQLLVSILPSLPSSLAIPLLEAVRASLDQKSLTASNSGGVDKQYDHFFEVSEFCGAIAEKLIADKERVNTANKQDPPQGINAVDPVGEAILNLQWTVLSHKDAMTLKSYESIKKFVSSEICKHDTTTDKLRVTFLQYTCNEIKKNGMCIDPNMVDETHALHMVKLAKFLLEGYDRVEMEDLVCRSPTQPDQHFPTLLFRDLMSYMKRRSRVGSAMPPTRKVCCYFVAIPSCLRKSCS